MWPDKVGVVLVCALSVVDHKLWFVACTELRESINCHVVAILQNVHERAMGYVFVDHHWMATTVWPCGRRHLTYVAVFVYLWVSFFDASSVGLLCSILALLPLAFGNRSRNSGFFLRFVHTLNIISKSVVMMPMGAVSSRFHAIGVLVSVSFRVTNLQWIGTINGSNSSWCSFMRAATPYWSARKYWYQSLYFE